MPRGGAHFSSGELARVLSHYDVGIIQQARGLATGSTRAAKMVIVSQGGKFLLKRRARGKDEPYRVAFAHCIQIHLGQMNFPVAALVPSRDGDTMLHLDSHIYELFEYVSGSRYDGSAEATTDAGRQLARFHVHLADFAMDPVPNPTKRKSATGGPAAGLAAATDWRPSGGSFHDSATVRGHLKTLASEQSGKSAESTKPLRRVTDALRSIYDASSRRVNEMGFDSWPEQVVHGDWHPGNMLFSARRIVAVLDFDSVKLARGVTDLANAMLQFSIVAGRPNPADWPDYLDQARLVQVFSGYQQVSSLPEARINALLDLMIETMVAEAVLPIAATGFFGNLSGLDFLKMIRRKCDWINNNRDTLTDAIRHGTGLDSS